MNSNTTTRLSIGEGSTSCRRGGIRSGGYG